MRSLIAESLNYSQTRWFGATLPDKLTGELGMNKTTAALFISFELAQRVVWIPEE